MLLSTVMRKLFLLVVCIFCLVIPTAAQAGGHIIITVTNPDHNGKGDYIGNTVNTVLSTPNVSFGENRVLGTMRITGKKNITTPVKQGDKVKVSLPVGLCYLQTPTAESYRNYVEWPEELNGRKNQICDSKNKPGVKFVSATARSITVEVNNVDSTGEVMALDFVYNKENFSTVRVSRLLDKAKKYKHTPDEQVTRLEFFKMLADITDRFPSCPVEFVDNDQPLDERFADVADISPQELDYIKQLVDAEVIGGYGGDLLKPDEYITWFQAAGVVERILQNTDWVININAAVSDRFVAGLPEKPFKPNQLITKIEALNLAQKTLETYEVNSEL